MPRLISLAFVMSLSGAASAQSLNIDFGDTQAVPLSGPSAAYAGAGRHGAWNVLGNMPANVRFNLVARDGQAIASTVYNVGGSAMLDADNPGTSGNDERLMDDMFLSFNDPIDLCLFFENMLLGEYEVIVYAMTPDDAGLQCRVRVDFAQPGPVMIGGAWPGGHIEGVTYARHIVTVSANGRLGLHSGLFGGQFQSGINGLQLLYREPCPGDANRDYDVTFGDVTSVLENYGQTGDPGPPGVLPGDANGDGVVNFGDVTSVLGEFGKLC